MKHDITTSARRGIIQIGKYAPFVIVAIVTLSNIETVYSVMFDRYATFGGVTMYYKPVSWWIGRVFELNIAWILALTVLSIGVEACIWNRIAIAYLSLVLFQIDFFLEHDVSDKTFMCVLSINCAIGVFLITKGLKKLNLFCGTK